jgi:TRAP-type C4-dicarboxylate transport system permease small subunit
MKQILSWLDRNTEQLVCSVFSIAMVLVLAVNVFCRYIWGYSFTSSEELARFCFLWVVFTASSLAAQKDAHIRMTAPTDWLSEKGKRYLLVVADAIWLCFNVFVVIEGCIYVASMVKFPYIAPASGISMVYMYSLIPICFSAMVFRILQRYYRKIKYGWEVVESDSEVRDV